MGSGDSWHEHAHASSARGLPLAPEDVLRQFCSPDVFQQLVLHERPGKAPASNSKIGYPDSDGRDSFRGAHLGGTTNLPPVADATGKGTMSTASSSNERPCSASGSRKSFANFTKQCNQAGARSSATTQATSGAERPTFTSSGATQVSGSGSEGFTFDACDGVSNGGPPEDIIMHSSYKDIRRSFKDSAYYPRAEG
jgi:hypothetical protein